MEERSRRSRADATQVGDDAEKRRSLEAKLVALRSEAEALRRQARAKKIDARYKRIRFFERRKLERTRRRIERERKCRPDDPALVREMEQVLDDLRYVRRFPSGEKYVSVLAEGDEHVRRKRDELRRLVRDERNRALRSPSDDLGSVDDANEADQGDWDDVRAHEEASEPSKDASEPASDDDFFLQADEGEGAAPNRSEDDGVDVLAVPSRKRDGSDGTRGGGRKPCGVQRRTKPNLPPRTKGRSAARADGKTDADGKRKEADRPRKKMPLRTRAEGGRKRRKKKK